MVSKPRQHITNNGPPPLDESWWEAVLAEDEALWGNGPGAKLDEQTHRTRSQELDREQEYVDWHKAQSLYDQDLVIEMIVTGYNRGGLLVNGDDLQGFVPLSHLIDMPDDKDNPEPWLSTYIDRELSLKVIECDRDRGRVVFSERAALARSGQRNLLLEELQDGQCVNGAVTNITDFGVFVDLGGVEGLIHVSEISWGRVRHPHDVVELGERLDVHVIQVDRERARVALSLKRLRPNPWETAHVRYAPGQIVDAVVTSIVPFGAFARLEEGLDGLIHISEITGDRTISHPAEVLREGQHVRVRVLHVDGLRQRLGLSMRFTE